MIKLLTLGLSNIAITATLAGLVIAHSSSATEPEPPSQEISAHLQSIFVGKDVTVNDYDDQLKEVLVGDDSLFASHDGRYIFAGPVFDTHRRIDIVAERELFQRKELISAQPKDLFVRYPSAAVQTHQVTVVTDIDCPYCRKLHNSIGELNELGISINYLMLPRAGVDSTSYVKTLNALCSDDPAGNITKAMAAQNLDPAPKGCDPIQLTEHMKLVQRMKIRSTPTFVLPNGELQVGLLRPDHLLRVLETIKQ